MSLACASVLAGLAAHPVAAATLQISPVMVELAAKDKASGLTLRNPGDQPIYGQVRVYTWHQVDGENVLAPTQDIVASPPLIRIPARAEQLVRLVRPAPAADAAEHSYRLLIDELPEPDAGPADGVTIRLRYSVPVFVEPPGIVGTPRLTWSLQRGAKGWDLVVENTGTRRAQISAVELVEAGGTAHSLGRGLLGYALAGRTRRWRVALAPDAALAGTLAIRAAVNAVPVSASVRVEPRP
ncbi:MAG: molecular chaperone [Pararobbsia sp.]